MLNKLLGNGNVLNQYRE